MSNLTGQKVRQKLPKPIKDRGHRQFVASLPCLACGKPGPSQAHHVRVGAYQLGKRQCDSRCVPLCEKHHRILHNMHEEAFWADVILKFTDRVAPLPIAAALYAVSGDEEQGRLIVLGARSEGKVT